jgi:hypothetical protein
MRRFLLFIFIACTGTFFAQTFPKGKTNLNAQAQSKYLPPVVQQTSSVISLEDSIYWWRVDTTIHSLNFERKQICLGHNADNKPIGWLSYSWNDTTNSWVIPIKDTIFYDANYNVISGYSKTWNGTVWVNTGRDTLIYNSNNQRTCWITQSWDTTHWLNINKYTYTYNSNNKITNDSIYLWNGTSWMKNVDYIYAYDTASNLTLNWRQGWTGYNDTVLGTQEKNTYSYYANNVQACDLLQLYSGNTLIGTSRDTTIYFTKNNQTVELRQQWGNTSWFNVEEQLLTYDANNNILTDTAYNWGGSAWVNYYISANTYNSNNKLIRSTNLYWQDSVFVKNGGETYTYDANNNETGNSNKSSWNGTYYTSQDSEHFYYSYITGINKQKQPTDNFIVFPNPASYNVTIKSAEAKSYQVQLYNVIGQVVYNHPNILQVFTFDVSTLANGLYIVQLTDIQNGKVGRQKLIVK